MIFQTALLESLRANHDRVAIENGDERFSYAEILSLSNKVTAFLLKKDLPAGTVIGIQMNDRTSLICTIIGILNARCVFVPIDPALPARRIEDILSDLGPTLIITEEMMAGMSDDVDAYPDYSPNDNIYVYYTSGTTGRPKGIVGRNASLLQFLRWEIGEFGIDGRFRVSQLISPYFDAFLRDIFVPLLAGGTICIPPQNDDLFTPEKLAPWIDSAAIDLIHCVPSVFRLINHISIHPEQYSALRYVLLSGEKIIPSELSPWYRTIGSRVQLVNLYGATETTMIRSFYRIDSLDAQQSRIGIGSPIAGTQLLVAQPDLRPCNKLVTGDLYILSEYVSNGYLNAPALNQQRFIKIGPGKSGDVMAFRTGDKARVLADGRIELLGREDRQVKVRGIRVELDEIEYMLCQSSAIRNAVVINEQEAGGGGRLLAFILPVAGSKEGTVLSEQLGEELKKSLPEYMLPSKITVVEAFPTLPNGKINYQALLNVQDTEEISAPRDEIESRLLSIWKEILGDKPVSTTAAFHNAGGNSLSIMRLISKIYSEYGVRVPLSELFRNLTIQKQAVLIKKLKKDKSLLITRSPVKPFYFPSSAQERIYFSWVTNKEGIAYNMPMAWEIRGQVDLLKIEQALQALVARHAGLRTEFRQEGLRIVQVIKDTVDFQLEKVEACQGEISQAIASFIRPFDLGRAPLIRGAIIMSGRDTKILLVDIHHIVCDGISQANLYADFLRLYRGDVLSDLPLQYTDYAEWEEGYRRSDEYISYREYWLKNFDGNLPQLELPSTNAGKEGWSDKGGHVDFQISKARFGPIPDLLQTNGITTFSGLFSIFYLFLSRLTGQDDIIIGINTSGRVQPDLEKVVGMFVKTLPIRCRFDLGQSFRELVDKVHEYLIGANTRQMYDLADITGELSRNREVPVANLFNVMFVFQNFDIEEVDAGDVIFSSFQFENNTAKYPITLFASEGADAFYFKFEYSSSFFTRADISLLAGEYRLLVDQLAANLDADLAGLQEDDADGQLPMNENIEFNL